MKMYILRPIATPQYLFANNKGKGLGLRMSMFTTPQDNIALAKLNNESMMNIPWINIEEDNGPVVDWMMPDFQAQPQGFYGNVRAKLREEFNKSGEAYTSLKRAEYKMVEYGFSTIKEFQAKCPNDYNRGLKQWFEEFVGSEFDVSDAKKFKESQKEFWKRSAEELEICEVKMTVKGFNINRTMKFSSYLPELKKITMLKY